jgi:hypothetical protein
MTMKSCGLALCAVTILMATACSKESSDRAGGAASGNRAAAPTSAAEPAVSTAPVAEPIPPASSAAVTEATPATSAAPRPVAVAKPAPAAPVRVSFAARDRRLSALIENAAARDPSGQVLQDAANALAARRQCPTLACVEGSYAAEERALNQWDGAGEIMRRYPAP